MNTKTETPKFFCHKDWKTDLKNSQNHKTEIPNALLCTEKSNKGQINEGKFEINAQGHLIEKMFEWHILSWLTVNIELYDKFLCH